MVRRWVASYRQHGVSGLRKKFSHYSAEFKLSVLRRMQQEELSAHQAIVLFNIRGGTGVIADWQRRYHEQGLAGLQPKPRGRSKKMSVPESPKSADPLPDDKRSREDLMEEVQSLRAEVAYLKKLRALLQAKEQAAQKKRR
jgi:transposase